MGCSAHGPIRPDGHCAMAVRRGLARAVNRDWDRTACYVPACPAAAAANNAVYPSTSLLIYISIPCVNSHLIILERLSGGRPSSLVASLAATDIRALVPSNPNGSSLTIVSPPPCLCTSASITSTFPRIAAICSTLTRFQLTEAGFALYSNSNLTQSTCPCSAAANKGVAST